MPNPRHQSDGVEALPQRNVARYDHLTRALEWPMAILALAVIPVLMLDDGAVTPLTHAIATGLNWIIWIAFCGDFGARYALVPDRQRFLRRSWFDLLIIVVSTPFGVPDSLQTVRALRALRIVRLVRALAFLSIGVKTARRAFKHRKFHYVLILTAAVMVLAASGLYVVEREQNESLTSFWDALWWAISTTTTVGYGEIYPVTGEGRLIAVLLMLTGIGVIGVFTATIASLFMIEDEEDEFSGLHKRLDTIETKLDRLVSERDRQRGPLLPTESTGWPNAAP
jgi:voltage-gated potassium channel